MVSDVLIDIIKDDERTEFQMFKDLKLLLKDFMKSDRLEDLAYFQGMFLLEVGILKAKHLMSDPSLEDCNWDEASAIRHYIEDYEAMERWCLRSAEYMSTRLQEYCEALQMSEKARLTLMALTLGAVTDSRSGGSTNPAAIIKEFLEAYSDQS